MCSRFVLVRKLEKLEARFNAKAVDGLKYKESFNISPGKASLIIAQDSPKLIKSAIFGLTPFWAKKPMYLINARAEGDKNKENDTNYKGAKDIIIKPAFRKPIRSNRCLILADAFIEGTSLEKLSKPFLIFMKDKIGAFAFAGIYDDWLNTKNGEYIRSFAIITSVANNLMQKIPHHRSPVILRPSQEKLWLNSNASLNEITNILNPFDSSNFNAYQISDSIKNPNNDYKNLIFPISDEINPD